MNFSDPISNLLGSWSGTLNVYSVLLRMGLSLIFALLIGCERSVKVHSAGMKTFTLITVSTTCCMVADLYISHMWFPIPVCSAAALICIAILGSNSVLCNAKNQVTGLTTSVLLWFCGILGLITGLGLYTVSLALFAAGILILIFFPKLEKKLKNTSAHFEIHLELKNKGDLPNFITTLRRLGISVSETEINSAFIGSGISVYAMKLSIVGKDSRKASHDEIIEALRGIDYVLYIEEAN